MTLQSIIDHEMERGTLEKVDPGISAEGVVFHHEWASRPLRCFIFAEGASVVHDLDGKELRIMTCKEVTESAFLSY